MKRVGGLFLLEKFLISIQTPARSKKFDPVAVNAERVRGAACRPSEIYDLRYLVRTLADARTSIRWPKRCSRSLKYIWINHLARQLLSPTKPN